MKHLASSTESLHAIVEGHVGWILIDNPARKNAFTLAMWEALPQLVDALESDCIRFVYFSRENELRSRIFAEKLGLEAGWVFGDFSCF